MPPVQYQSKNLNHLGLVAAMYVAETLQLLDEQKQRFVSRVPLNIKDANVVGLKERQWTIIQILGIFYESIYF